MVIFIRDEMKEDPDNAQGLKLLIIRKNLKIN